MIKRILVTGASGCIGHYLVEALIQQTTCELYLLVRNPEKLRFDYQSYSYVHIVQADMRDIDNFADLLNTMDIAIVAAAAWGGAKEAFDVNVLKTIRLLELLNPRRCEQVIYFSTASILDNNHELLQVAGTLGTEYISSKYDCIRRFSRLAIAPRITTLFPTLVVGGEDKKPYSHVSTGLPEILKWINLIRFFKADGSFHFIHARDIAQIVLHLIDHPPEPARPFVLGNPSVTVDQAIEEICALLNKKIHFRVPLSPILAEISIVLFKIKISAWDRYCLQKRHFTYKDAVSPATFGLSTYYSTLTDIFKSYALVPPPPEPPKHNQTEPKE